MLHVAPASASHPKLEQQLMLPQPLVAPPCHPWQSLLGLATITIGVAVPQLVQAPAAVLAFICQKLEQIMLSSLDCGCNSAVVFKRSMSLEMYHPRTRLTEFPHICGLIASPLHTSSTASARCAHARAARCSCIVPNPLHMSGGGSQRRDKIYFYMHAFAALRVRGRMV